MSVRVLDEPGAGGACHRYLISTPNKPLKQELAHPSVNCEIEFQNGPVAEAGTNGVTHESLLAILIDRLEGFQSGPYAHHRNGEALSGLRNALDALKARTAERVQRGVEGTRQP